MVRREFGFWGLGYPKVFTISMRPSWGNEGETTLFEGSRTRSGSICALGNSLFFATFGVG